MLMIDVANGYQESFVEHVKRMREKFPNTILACGNVVTPEMTQELILNGADIVKIGIGSGSVCHTRIKTGVGYPQLSAIMECMDAAHGLGGHICSDGGCKTPADVAKAFAAGADFAMIGGMLSSTEECSGDWIYDKKGNKLSLKFYGMSSKEAMKKYNGGIADYKATEGKCVTVPYKGKVDGVIKEILGGLRSACSYVGTGKLKDLSKCTTFIRVNRTHNILFGN